MALWRMVSSSKHNSKAALIEVEVEVLSITVSSWLSHFLYSTAKGISRKDNPTLNIVLRLYNIETTNTHFDLGVKMKM